MTQQTFEELDPDLQERIKLRIAQDAGIVIKQAERLLMLLDQMYYHKVKNTGPEMRYKEDSFAGEVYLFLIAASQFGKRFLGESSPECLSLNKSNLNDVRIVRNIWEHHADYMVTGKDAFSSLRSESRKWIDERLPGRQGQVFVVSSYPGTYTIAEHVNILKIVKEAREWWDLVL